MSFDLKLTRGDVELSGGSLSLVQNQSKLIQDALKMLFTTTGENGTHPWYGTPLLARAVGQSANSAIIQTEIADAINYGLNNLKILQQLQEQDSQFITPQELISEVRSVDAKLSEEDRRKLIISVEIVARSNDLIQESFVVNV